MADKEGKADAQPFHLVLLAQDLVGYRNLCRLDHRCPYRRLLLQAPDRSRAPRPAQRGPDRTVGLPGWRDPASARDRRLGARPQPGRRIWRHLRQGPLLPRAPGPRPGRAAPAERAAPAAGARGGPAPGRDQRPPLRPPGPGRGARRPALRRHRQQPRHAGPDEVRDQRLLAQVGGRDGGPLPGPARGDPEHATDRRDGRWPRAAARPDPDPALPGTRRRDRRELAAARMRAGLARRYGGGRRRRSRRASTTSSA